MTEVLTFEGFGNAFAIDKQGNTVYAGETTPTYKLFLTEETTPLTPVQVIYETVDVNGNKLVSTGKLPAAFTGSIDNKGPIPDQSEAIPGLGENFTDGSVTFNTYYVLFESEEEPEPLAFLCIYSCGLIGPNKDIYYASNDILGLTSIDPAKFSKSNTNSITNASNSYFQKVKDSFNLVNVRNTTSNTNQFSPKTQSFFKKFQKQTTQESLHKLLKNPQHVAKKISQQQSKSKKNCKCKNKK